MNSLWIAVIGTSALAFALKYAGMRVPERFTSHPRLQAVNTYIPIALLAALVAVQGAAHQEDIVIDHRLVGLAVATIALLIRAPYFIVVISAALSSAMVVHFF